MALEQDLQRLDPYFIVGGSIIIRRMKTFARVTALVDIPLPHGACSDCQPNARFSQSA